MSDHFAKIGGNTEFNFRPMMDESFFILERKEKMIKLEHVTKTFQTRNGNVNAVRDVSLEIQDGEIFGIIGFSGAGKSTLVRCINLLEKPEQGAVYFDDKDLLKLSDKELRLKRQEMGMIFQHFNLMRSRTVFENIAFPLRHMKMKDDEIQKRVDSLLELIELKDRKDSYPSQLSGGQKQRVAIARALATRPKVLLCDEATSALDPHTTQQILQLIRRINKELNLTVILITHEMAVVKDICDRVAVMENGKVVEEGNIVDVFSHPKMPVTKNFINTTNNLGKIDELLENKHPLVQIDSNQRLVKLSYQSGNTKEALISTISRKYNVDCSIIFGNVEIVHDVPFGTLICVLTGKQEDMESALQLCEDNQVQVEVMK